MPGTIVTFYSYKGGVGRSFALVNTATILASWGFRVLCVDWDLEAPGLDAYFQPYLDGPPRRGLAEALTAFVAGERVDPGAFVTPVALPGVRGQVDLLPAGHPADLVRLVQRLDWASMYAEHDLGATLEQWRAAWTGSYHFVLIDSRTGITDIGGVCTAQMPDVLVPMFTANEQSVRGVRDVIERAEKARDNLPYDRARLLVLPVPSRFEGREEYREAERWRGRFAEVFGPAIEQWVHQRTPVASVLAQVTIPYVAYWSFGERIAALEETEPTPNDICYPLQTLAALLAHRLDRTQVLGESRESYVAAAARQGLRATQGPATSFDVFLNQVPGSAAGPRFQDALEGRGLTVVVSPATPDPDALARSADMILLIEGKVTDRQVSDAELFLRQTLDDRSDRSLLPILLPGSTLEGLPQTMLQIDRDEAHTSDDVEDVAERVARDSEYRVARRRVDENAGDPELGEADLIRGFRRLARLAEERGDQSVAYSMLFAAARFSVPGDRVARMERGYVLVDLGAVARELANLDESLRWLNDAVAVFEGLINDDGSDPELRFGLGNAYHQLAATQRERGAFGDAALSLDLAVNWLADSADGSALLTFVLGDRAGVRQLRGDYDGALADLTRMVELTDALSEAAGALPVPLSHAATARIELGKLYLALGDNPRAAAAFAAAAGLLLQAAEASSHHRPASQERWRAATVQVRQGDALAAFDPARAAAAYTAAIATYAAVTDRSLQTTMATAVAFLKRAGMARETGDGAAAIADLRRVVDLLRGTPVSDIQAQQFLAGALGQLGEAVAAEDPNGARHHLAESLEIELRLAGSDQSATAGSRSLGAAHRRVAAFEAAQGNQPAALMYYRRALAAYRSVGVQDEVRAVSAEMARIEGMVE